MIVYFNIVLVHVMSMGENPICIFCGCEMKWDNDFQLSDLFDVDEDDDRVVSAWSCPNCGASVEYTEGSGDGESDE